MIKISIEKAGNTQPKEDAFAKADIWVRLGGDGDEVREEASMLLSALTKALASGGDDDDQKPMNQENKNGVSDISIRPWEMNIFMLAELVNKAICRISSDYIDEWSADKFFLLCLLMEMDFPENEMALIMHILERVSDESSSINSLMEKINSSFRKDDNGGN